MPDEQDPPRKFYGLKPKEFERVNKTPREQPADLRPDPGIVSSDKERIDVRDILRVAAHGTPLLGGSNAPANRPNEVHAVLRENHEVANAAGLNDVSDRPKRPSRRKRDYWLMMIPVTVFCGTTVVLTGPKTPFPFVLSLSALVLFNAGLWWVMWHVMDDY
jgi:hypothetical protein